MPEEKEIWEQYPDYDFIKNKYNKTKKWWFCYGDDTAVEKTREKFGDKIAFKVEELIRQNQN